MNDFTKSGEFIASLRKERGLTQSELATMIGVGDKSVSKWERGINVPDILVIQSLAEIFNVSVSEILEGKKKEKIDPEIIKIYENKYARYSILGVLIFLVISFFTFLIYFCNNYDKNRVYRFKGEGDNYSLSGNVFLVGNDKKIIVDDFVVYDIEKYNGLLTNEYKVNIYFDDDLICFFSKSDLGTNDDLRYTYGKIIDIISHGELVLNEFDYNNINGNGYMKIEFVYGEDKYTEKFDFNYILESRNNSFFYKK